MQEHLQFFISHEVQYNKVTVKLVIVNVLCVFAELHLDVHTKSHRLFYL